MEIVNRDPQPQNRDPVPCIREAVNKCPKCLMAKTVVDKTWVQNNGGHICRYRHRKCKVCGYSWNTHQTLRS